MKARTLRPDDALDRLAEHAHLGVLEQQPQVAHLSQLAKVTQPFA